jgi:hypothetical protein
MLDRGLQPSELNGQMRLGETAVRAGALQRGARAPARCSAAPESGNSQNA